MEIDEFERMARLDGVDVDAMIAYYERRGQLQLEFHDLAITQIFSDMAKLQLQNTKAFILIEFMLMHPLLSLREMSDIFTVPRTTLSRILENAAKELPWLSRMLDLKKRQNVGHKRASRQHAQVLPALRPQTSRGRGRKGTGTGRV
jgi:hypothetical protein